MKLLLRKSISLLAAVFVVNVVSISHVSAMPVGAHHMEGAAGSVSTCATICLSAPGDKQKGEEVQLKDEDDQPDKPYHTRFTAIDIYLYMHDFPVCTNDQTGKLPLYKLHCVIRR